MVTQKPGDGATKRKSTAEHGGGSAAKRIKLEELAYDGMVTVTAMGTHHWLTGRTPHPGKPFSVYKQLLSWSSPYMKFKIDKQRHLSDVEIELSETHWAHFEVYFKWIHKHFISSDAEARSFLVDHFRGFVDGQLFAHEADELCSLLQMGKMLEDTAFTTDVVRMMEEPVLRDSSSLLLDLDKLTLLWSVRELGSSDDIETWMLGQRSLYLTREYIESERSTIDSGLLEALRKVLPFTTLKIRTGKGAREQKITVNRRCATMRSSVLANVFKAGNGNSRESSTGKATLEASGDIILGGNFEPGALDNWSHTLANEGAELKDLFLRNPNIKTNLTQACDLKAALCGMGILAEALGDQSLCKTIITTLIEYRNDPTKCLPNSLTWKAVHLVIAKTPLDSGLRRWVVDFVASGIVLGEDIWQIS